MFMVFRNFFAALILVGLFLTGCVTAETPTPQVEAPTSLPATVLAPTPEQAIEAGQKSVTLAVTEYPPYYGEHLEGQGPLSEIIITAYQRMGYEVRLEFFPWARALETAQDGTVDGIFSMWYRADREEWFAFSDPMVPNEIGFYKWTSDTISFERLEDLEPYVVGVVRGYANTPEFDQASYITKEEATDDEMNIRKLCKQRVDLILTDKELARYLIDTNYPECSDSLEWMEPALEIVPQYLAISRLAADYQTKLNDFNEGLKRITEDGSLQQILTKHGF